MIDSSEVNDLQLEDVEDYSSDYPPPGFPQAEANIHTTSETNKTPNYRRAKIIELIRTNKWVAGVVFVTLVVFITIISVVAGSAKGGSSTSENSAETEPHQPPIVIDPDTLDPEIAGPLEESLVNTYQRHGLDTVDLENDDGTTPARKAFHWLATEKNLENMDHTQKMQRYALSVFYYATNAVTTPYTDNPKPWVSAHLWLTNAHVCEWKGIVCNSQQHVIAIDLERNNLSGSIPAEIGFMASTLTTIDLTSNLIYMEGNMFSALDDLVNIETFLMDDNYLEFDKGLPAAFVHMTKMEKLRLSYNLLEGELESGHKVLANMPKLTHLEVESNFLTGTIPPIISEMENLVYLYLRRNAMKFNLDFLKGGQMTSLCKNFILVGNFLLKENWISNFFSHISLLLPIF